MRDLRARATSGLLRFPEVTIQALGEDEISLDSVLCGKFSGGRNVLAWLACGPQLEVVNSVTGERLSAYRFGGVNEQPPTVRVVKEFSWQKRTGLLVGLEEAEGSVLCLYDLAISRVVKAVVLPGRVTAIEPITNDGGASVSTRHLHQSLRWLFGVAVVATDVGHLLLVDLCLDDLSCSQNEIEASDLEVVTRIPAEVPQRRETVTREGRHLCFELQNPSGTSISTLCYISRSNQLAVGFSDGYLSLWNMKTLKREHHSQLEGGRIPVYVVTFQEPENDPRNCCYLWAVQSTQESEGDVVSLHLLQLAFGDRKRLASGQVMYEGLEYCDERYSLELTGGVFPLRGQTSNTKLLSCQTVEKFRNHVDREDSVNEVVSPDTSVSIFSWQVNTYGQAKPSTYLGVFDINRWYHAQMPDSLRPEEFLHDCPYFALWSLDSVISMTSPNLILDIVVHERSLSRGVPPSYPPPEQYFNPSTYNFDGTCLLKSGVVHMTCTGFQKETLNFLKKSGPSVSEAIHDSYNRCLAAGLLSPRLADVQPSSLSQEEQLQAVLSAAVHTGSLELLTGCIKHWTSEEQPNSAANLRFVLEWTWNKVVYAKHEFDQIGVPLFDGSCNFIDPQTLQSLQHCQLLLSNLSTILNCFLREAQELTEKGCADLRNKQVVTSLISLYAQVVIWFCRSSLLPEGLDDDMHLSRPFYNYPLMQRYYTGHRQKLERLSGGKWDSDCLMIDGMVSQLGEEVEKLWQRDEGGTGKYPPASLHALLDLYLLEGIEESYKHAITIYLLLDIMHSFPNKTETSIDSFPTAFGIPWGLVKLIQGYWLLDHNDYENSLSLLFHPATIKTVSWQHRRIIQALMIQGEHRRALRYLQMMKPSMSSSSEVRLFLTVLLSNRCMVEAWGLLHQHTTKLNTEELLKHMYELCQEMGLMEDLLKLPFTDTEQECLEKFLQTNAGVQNHEFLLVHRLQRSNYIPALQLNQSMKVNLVGDRDPRLRERAVARNSILEQYGKILPRVQRKLAVERAKPYHLFSSVVREVARPKPLSTVARQANAGHVHTRATFISNVLSKIGEVWVGNAQKTSFSQYDSPRATEPPAHPLPAAELPDAFVGTPVTEFSQKRSRLLDSVVRPVPSCSAEQGGGWRSPCRDSTSLMVSSPVHSNLHGSISQKKFSRASELNLLETPLVVKRAKDLAMSASGFPGFTPQSILRSSLRTTPLATPSASPGRSVTPPLRAKEPRISFREEGSSAKWTVGVTVEGKLLSKASSDHHRGVMEDAWSESRVKTALFALSSPEKDGAGMEESSESVPGDGLENMDVSKENSNVSARSDQTTLEYHDAKSPGDFEDDVIFIAAKPAISSVEEDADFQESETEEDSEMVEDKPFQMEEPGSSERREEAGFVEESNAEYLTLPDSGKLMFKAAEAAAFGTASEGETNHQESKMPSSSSEEKVMPVATNPQLSESPEADSESVISILDSEDVVSAYSERHLEEKYVDLPKEPNLEAAEVEAEVPSPQEETTVASSLPKTEEINVIEYGVVKAQASEDAPETSLYSELHPPGSLLHSCDTIEQQLACDLPDNEGDECDAAEGDGELFIPQSNFTLVLEGDEGEAEMGDPTLADGSKAAGTTTEEKRVSNLGNTENQEHVTNSVSTVTSDQESQNTAESLPYVPEPIKVAIAENLLDVIKDTRSKEFTSEAVEQSIHETIGKKVTRFQKAKAPLTAVPEGAEDETSRHQVDYVITPRTRARGHLRSLNIPSAGDPQLRNTEKPVLFGLSPRRSTRRTKEASETSSLRTEETAQEEQIPVMPVTPRRGRKPKQANIVKVESGHSDDQTLSVSTQSTAVTPRRGLRRAKEAASALLEEANEETSLAKGIITASATATPKRTRGGKSSVRDPETDQTDTDHKKKTAVSPSRSARKPKSISLQFPENTVKDQEVQPSDQLLSPVPTKRGRRRKISPSEVSENSDLNLSKSLLSQTEFKLPVTPRRSARKGAQNLLADTESVSTQEDTPSGGKVAVLDAPRRRARRILQAKPGKTDTHEQTPAQSKEDSTTPRTPVRTGRRGRKKRSIQEESTGEEAFPQGPGGSPLLPEGTNPSGYSETSRASTDRITRTRSHKTAMHPKLSVEENESFLFSPPLTKLTKKFKAEKADHPVQLKDIDPDLSSQFVFSPPLLRSRSKNVSSISRIVTESELPTKEEEDTKPVESVGKQKLKRGRTAKSKVKKTSKTTRKEGSWSPPPVEIKFISPFASPADGTKSKQKETTDMAEKTLRKSKKRLSNFPKPVVRRRML